MEAIKVKANTGPDGVLRLEVPTGLKDASVEVTVVLNAAENSAQDRAEWLAFIEETAGSLAHDPMERPSQGEYEIRDAIK